MNWIVNFHTAFVGEFAELPDSVKIELRAMTLLLQEAGPQLSRPHADTLDGSKHANMKELRFKANDGVWRVAFAFDPKRQAILLIAGDKSGVNQQRFYKTLIAKADARFDDHLLELKGDQ